MTFIRFVVYHFQMHGGKFIPHHTGHFVFFLRGKGSFQSELSDTGLQKLYIQGMGFSGKSKLLRLFFVGGKQFLIAFRKMGFIRKCRVGIVSRRRFRPSEKNIRPACQCIG